MPYKRINPNDHIGKTYHRLTVVAFIWRRERGRAWVRCQCECGTTTENPLALLVRGRYKSCGCLSSDRTAERNTTHGKSHLPEYGTWKHIIQRCENRNHKDWEDYGGRGITICPEWRHDFEAFLRHVGPRPSSEYMIDRIDNSDGYRPGNVRWAVYQTQQRNRRSNVYVEYRGERVLLIELCDRLGISTGMVRQRIHHGWTVEDAVSIPSHNGYWSYAEYKRKESLCGQ